MKRRSLHVRDEQAQAVSEILRAARESEQHGDLGSEAEVFRLLLDHAIEHAELADLVPEAVEVLAERERFIEQEARLNDLRTGFETRVKREFEKRFENGYDADKLETWSDNMVREAHVLWPVDGEADHAERRQEALRYIQEHVEQAAEAAEVSEWSPLDPAESYGHRTGVQEAQEQQEQEQREQQVQQYVPEALSLLNDGMQPGSAERRLVSTYGVPADMAGEAVDRAINRDSPVPGTTPEQVQVRPDGGEANE
jgi:hypothetical protein